MCSMYMHVKKAVFMIVLIVTTIFYSANIVSAETSGCCERTVSGDLCTPTFQTRCSSGFHPGITCNTVTSCQLGCCSSFEGGCSLNSPKSTCENGNGNWSPDPTCSISTCEKNCCVIGDNCIYTTQRACALDTQKLGLQLNFQTVADEISCLEFCAEVSEGCCVGEDLGCSYGDFLGCTGQFVSGKFCSGVKECFCKEKDHKECYEDDVYWFDYCGNSEGLVEDCTYEEGNKCRETDVWVF